MQHLSCLLTFLSLAFQPAQPVTCALTGVELPSATAICPYTGEPAATAADPASFTLDFESMEQTLTPISGAAVTRRTEGAKCGSGYLEVDCRGLTPRPGELPPGVALMGAPRPIGSLAFWARSDGPSQVALLAVEEDQSAYFMFLFLPGGRWQRIVVDLDSLVAAPDTAPDENGKLDLDQVAGLILCDPLGFEGTQPEPSKLVLAIDDVSLRPRPVRAKPVSSGSGVLLGDFSVSALGWMPVGPGEPDLVELADDPGVFAARLTTTDTASFTAWMAVLPAFGMRGTWLSMDLDVRAEYACQIAVGATEDTGAEYYQIIDIPEGGTWRLAVARADAFSQSPDKPDRGNGKLDTDRVTTIAIAVLPTEPGTGAWRNVIDIRRVVAVPLQEEARDADPFR